MVGRITCCGCFFIYLRMTGIETSVWLSLVVNASHTLRAPSFPALLHFVSLSPPRLSVVIILCFVWFFFIFVFSSNFVSSSLFPSLEVSFPAFNWLVFITVVESVYCAVRTGSLNKAFYASSLKGQLTGFYNRGGKCLLRGTNWIFK